MSNCVFGWPLYSDVGVTQTPALSGGSWTTALPLTNLQDRRLSKVARSSDALATSTTFDIDLGVARSIGVLSVLLPNITKSAVPTIQWKGGTSAGASDVYNPGAVAAWPTGVTAEDVTGADGSEMKVWSTTIPTTSQSARYWRCAIVDTANVDGYVDVARLVIAGAYTPTVNLAKGARTGHESETVRDVTDGGPALYRAKPRRRFDQFSINYLTQAEALVNVRKMQRQLGTSGQLFFVFDGTDTTYLYERAYLSVLRELSPLEYSEALYMSTPFSVVEEL